MPAYTFVLRLLGSNDLETICITIADYYNDYRHLRTHIRMALLKELLYKVVGEYIVAIDSRHVLNFMVSRG